MRKRRLPAEWEAQDAVQLTWPHANNGWPNGPPHVDRLFVELVSVISAHQQVIIASPDKAHVEHLLSHSQATLSQVSVYEQASNDCWVRDHGPIGVATEDGCELLNFNFNGWGNKYPCELDNASTAALAQAGAYRDTQIRDCKLVLEGGSIESNGVDTLMTTRRCLLHTNRNGQMSRQQMNAHLQNYFGMPHILWLEHGAIAGDDTDGHIDMLARFSDENSIVYCRSEDVTDVNHRQLALMEAELKAFRNSRGEPYELIPLPVPDPVLDSTGNPLPASYANFLIINNAVLVPVYQQHADEQALQLIQSCFPGRVIKAINCLPLIEQYGSLHCASMQIMAGVINPDEA